MARPRKPTLLKIVAGTTQPCRINANEPKPTRERPSSPAHLSNRGKAAWAEASIIADRMGVLTEADPIALEGLAEAIADIRAARASLDRPMMYGDVVMAAAGERYYWTEGKGGPMRRARPEIADIADADRRVGAWVARFGISPADRSKVSATPAEKINPFAALG
jgi:phage terminase small subunit